MDVFKTQSAPERDRRNLEMIFHEQTWWLLRDSQDQNYVSKEKVYILFRILMDPNQLSYQQMAQIIRSYFSSCSRRTSMQTDYSNNSGGPFKKWTKQSYAKQFKRLMQDRFHYIEIGNLKPKKQREYEQRVYILKKKSVEFTHSPRMNRRSVRLDELNQSKYSPYVDRSQFSNNRNSRFEERLSIMNMKIEKNQKDVHQKQKEKFRESFKECTFQPKLLPSSYLKQESNSTQPIHDRLYQHIPYEEREKIRIEKIKQQEQDDLCTFQPQINQGPRRSNSFIQPRGYENAIGRLRAAHQQHEEKQARINHIPKGENLDKIKNNPKIRPFSFVEKPKKPLLQVEVRISKTKVRKLTIFDKKKIQKTVEDFCQKYLISREKQTHLLRQIQLTLD